MTDEPVLREALEAHLPASEEPAEWEDVLRRAAVAPRAGSRRKVWALSAVAGAAVAATVAVVLAAPWQRGPAALTPAEVAVVLKRALSAVSPRPGWVFHAKSEWTLVPIAGAGRYAHVTSEVWKQNGPPYRFRLVNPNLLSPGFEVGGTGDPARAFVHDAKTNTLYRDDRLAAAASPPPGWYAQDIVAIEDVAARIGQQIEAGAPVTRTHVDGRSVYRFGTGQNTPTGFDGWTYYLDAKTYVPVRIETQGYPLEQPGGVTTNGRFVSSKYPATKTVERIVSYEYVPPTAAALKRADIEAQHPAAARATAAQMPPAVRDDVHPFVLAASFGLPTLNPAGAPTKRLLVDLDGRALGSLRLGEPLQTFMAVWSNPDQFTTSQLTLDPRNPADAVWFARDLRPWAVVGFADTAAMRANSIYYRGPFRTPRGDRNGTPLGAFLKHWPEHGRLQAQGTFVRVQVGSGYVWFDADRKLLAVQVGLGGAYRLAGLPGS